MGLLQANKQYNTNPGEGYQYLKNWTWWAGMTLMIIGEVSNFAAYAFTDAILVTPLGALTVVVAAIGSSLFLKERLSFVGKVACALCLVGASIIVVNAPSQKAVSTIQEMQGFVISPGFLAYAGTLIVICVCIIIWVAPRYGAKSMLVYLSVCSLIGSLSVVATQGLGAAIVAQAQGNPQFNQWFLYVLLVFVVGTLLTEIIYLNKALNIFNTSIVTPTYYVYFTSATIVSSAILFRGFGSSNPTVIVTVCLGFLVICGGVILLQLSKAANKVSDTAQLTGDLNDVKAVVDVEKAEEDPGADAIRGALNIRRFSTVRRTSRATNVDAGLTESINLQNRSMRRQDRENRKDGHFFNVPQEWTRRESTIREVPAEEERSSVQFDPSAPVTHIYPPQGSSSGKIDTEDHVEEVDLSRGEVHNPLSPVPVPSFLSAPPTPRYHETLRRGVQKQFSFGRAGRKRLTEEETIGLVESGKREGGMSAENDRDSESDEIDSDTESREEFGDQMASVRHQKGPYDLA